MRQQFFQRSAVKPILKRYAFSADITNITSTAQAIPVNLIAQGTGTIAERTERKIRARSLTFHGVFYWDTGGTPASVLRVIIADFKAGYDYSSIGINTNIYDRVSMEDQVGHVYKDFRVIRGSTDRIQTRIKFKVHPHRHYKYDGDANNAYADPGFNQFAIVLVTDNAAATSDMLFIHGVFRYYG